MSKATKDVYFVTGGGTGGHIYPAVAIADALLKEPDNEIYYIGNPDNLEKKVADEKGFNFLNVSVTGMPRKADPAFILWSLKLFVSTLKSLGYVMKYRPKAIIGTGGYVSAPALFAAIMTRTPIMIHDCDAIPGIVSRFIAPFAKNISVAFNASKKYLKSDKICLNGNPVREEFSIYDRYKARQKMGLQDKLTIIVMGGSQGAKKINSSLIGILEELFTKYDIQIIHQTGKKNYDEVVKELEEVYPKFRDNQNYILAPYFDEMYLPLLAADIAVSRAGSLSISEICMAGLASVLIPYPHAAADHQRKNAHEMELANAALYLDDNDCNPETLKEKLETIISDTGLMIDLQNEAKSLAKPAAVENIIKQIKQSVS